MAKECNTIFLEMDEGADMTEQLEMHRQVFPGNNLAVMPSVNEGKVIVKVACPPNRTMTGAMTREEALPLIKQSEGPL